MSPIVASSSKTAMNQILDPILVEVEASYEDKQLTFTFYEFCGCRCRQNFGIQYGILYYTDILSWHLKEDYNMCPCDIVDPLISKANPVEKFSML